MKFVAILVILIVLGAVWAITYAYARAQLATTKTQRPNPELEEARRIMYEISVHDDMIPAIPRDIRDRIDRQLGVGTNKNKEN